MVSFASLGTNERVDLVNIGLIILAGSLALFVPLPLFLFAYAVLGPLHYLTEISWLHDRSYFVRERKDLMVFIVASAMVTFLILAGTMPDGLAPAAVYLLFGAAFIITTIGAGAKRDLAIAILFITTVLLILFQPSLYVLLFAIFIPTIIHVFFFTGTFMLAGALKSKSFLGLISFFIFIAVAAGTLMFVPRESIEFPGPYFFQSYQPFMIVNESLIGLISPTTNQLSFETLFTSRIGQAVMQFIAFAYTYHYLNWFSKTRVIGWNKVSPRRRNVIFGGWLLAIVIYAYDYRIGVQVLLFLSLLHVLFEFPLNHRSFLEVGKQLRDLVRV